MGRWRACAKQWGTDRRHLCAGQLSLGYGRRLLDIGHSGRVERRRGRPGKSGNKTRVVSSDVVLIVLQGCNFLLQLLYDALFGLKIFGPLYAFPLLNLVHYLSLSDPLYTFHLVRGETCVQLCYLLILRCKQSFIRGHRGGKHPQVLFGIELLNYCGLAAY